MMKKGIKIGIILTLMIMIIEIIGSVVTVSAGWDQKMTTTTINDGGKIKSGMNTIIGVFQAVAMGVAIGFLILLGIKFMQTSPEGKANIKKQLTVYVVGAVLLFATTGVLEVIKGFTDEIVPASSSVPENTETENSQQN